MSQKAMQSAENEPIKFAVLAADAVVFTIKDNELYVRLITVNRPPHFVNMQGLPGGLLLPTETADEAVLRHIHAKTGITSAALYIEQLYTFSRVDRDRRGRVVAVGYLSIVPWSALAQHEQEDTEESAWVRFVDVKTLAYDHNEILTMAMKRLRSRVTYTTLISKFLPSEFTLTELKSAYDAILETSLDKRNFRKKILKLDILTQLDKERSGEPWRPAQLYKFKQNGIQEIEVV
jgi:8-oxo-dGTP diphosphatase